MTRERPTPAALHELLGERFSPLAVAAMLALGLITALTVLSVAPALPAWRLGLAGLLVADIGAGALANFTASTNAWYAARPRHRWGFIAAHVHLPAAAFLLGWPMRQALVAWAWTVGSAVVVNLLVGRSSQRVVAGGLFALSLLLPLATPTVPEAVAVSALFTLKVAYAFAVRHDAPAQAS